MSAWYVYLLQCRDGSLYTGIAVDVDRRYAQHAAGKGARYTRSHPPERVLARFGFPDRSAASRAEYAIKLLSPTQKRALCEVRADQATEPVRVTPSIPSLPMQRIDFVLDSDFVELNQLLKLVGLCDSGGAGKAIVASGAVSVDGAVELRKTCKIRAGQVVRVEDVEISVTAAR